MSEHTLSDEILQDIIQTLHQSYADKVELMQTSYCHAVGKGTPDYAIMFTHKRKAPERLMICMRRAILDPYICEVFERSPRHFMLSTFPFKTSFRVNSRFVYFSVDKRTYTRQKKRILRVLSFVLDLQASDPRELTIEEGLNTA